jgi:uncharacterized membrane protein YkoI
MPVRLSPTIAALALAAALIAPLDAASATESSCFVEWSDAAPVVEQERLTSARSVHDLARRHVLGDLMRITLCREAGSFVYRLLVRDRDGRLTKVKVDARHPFSP